MQNDLIGYHAGRPFNLIPEQSALLILDMQRYFLDPASHAFVPSAVTIVPRMMVLIETYRNLKLPVIFTKHLNTPGNAGSMNTWWKNIIRREDPMSDLIPEIAELNPTTLEKEQYDAFFGTDLEGWLHENNVTQVVIGGVMTHLCCETTARSAFVRGFDVFFLIDGTATYHIDFHRSSLLTLSHGFAIPCRIEQVTNRLESANKKAVIKEDGKIHVDSSALHRIRGEKG